MYFSTAVALLRLSPCWLDTADQNAKKWSSSPPINAQIFNKSCLGAVVLTEILSSHLDQSPWKKLRDIVCFSDGFLSFVNTRKALEILCESNRLSELPNAAEFDLLKSVLPFHLKVQSSNVRDKYVQFQFFCGLFLVVRMRQWCLRRCQCRWFLDPFWFDLRVRKE